MLTISKTAFFLNSLDPTDPASKHMTLAFSRSFCNSSATSVAWETTKTRAGGQPLRKKTLNAELGLFYLYKWSYGPLLVTGFWAHFD